MFFSWTAMGKISSKGKCACGSHRLWVMEQKVSFQEVSDTRGHVRKAFRMK